MFGGVVSALLMRASATVTDGVLTEEDVLRRSRAASLDTGKHLTIYGAGSEYHTRPKTRTCTAACTFALTLRWSLRTIAPAARDSVRRIHRVPADTLRDALARRKPGGHRRPGRSRHWLRPYSRQDSTPRVHCLDTGRATLSLATRAACAQVATLAPFASCAALIELFLRSNAICDLEEVTHAHEHH